MSDRPKDPPQPPRSDAADCGARLKSIDSERLFGDNDVVLIDHEGATYRLRKTRLGKLILTK